MNTFKLFDKEREYRKLKTDINCLHELVIVNIDKFVNSEMTTEEVEGFKSRAEELLKFYKDLLGYIKVDSKK